MKILGLEIRFPRISSSDRRGEKRIPVHETLYLDYCTSEPPQEGSAQALDISISEIRFISPSKLPKGAILDLTLRFPPGLIQMQTLKVRGHVVRSYRRFHQKRHRVVCAFDEMDASSLDQIQTFIRWLEERKEKFLFFRYRDEP